MLNNSTLTLQDVKDHFIRTREDENISDSDVIDAANDFYTLVHQYERKKDPNKYRAFSSVLSIDSTGYDITTLSDIADEYSGFRVYDEEVDVMKLRVRRHPGSHQKGYYLHGSTLKLTPTPSVASSTVIEYSTTGSRVSIGSTLSDHTLQINQDLERAFREYVRASFYDGEYQFDLKAQAEQIALAEIDQAFGLASHVVSI